MVYWMLKTFLANNYFLWNNEIFQAGAIEHASGWL